MVTLSAVKDEEQLELSSIASGNVKLCRHFGQQLDKLL